MPFLAFFLSLLLFFTSFVYAEDQTPTPTPPPVVLGQTYSAPTNNKLSVTFTKLPDNPGTLTVNEIKLSESDQEKLHSVSDSAFEITSSMENGTFTYDLTLPRPQNSEKVGVKSAPSRNELDEAKFINEPKEISSDTITIKNLDHFTVFVLVNDIDTDSTPGNSNDVANGVLSPINDTYADQKFPTTVRGTSPEIHVRSKSGGDNKRTFISFDTSSIAASSSVAKATLRLFMGTAPVTSRTLEAHRVTASWSEGTLIWNNQPSVDGVVTDGITTGTTNNIWLEWNVTSDVQNFVNGALTNFGWEIKDSAEDSVTDMLTEFHSANSPTVLKKPQLVVDFASSSDSPTDYKSPTAEGADSAGDGNGFEINPANAFADGGGIASDIDGAGDKHNFYNYNFSIPSSASIRGVEVRSDWYTDSTSGTNSLGVELSWDGGVSWTTAKSDITETTTEHISSFGGAADNWGRSWDPGDFSNANFRVRVTTNSTVSTRDFFLDWVPVRVYYSPDSTLPTGAIIKPANSFAHKGPPFEATASDLSGIEWVKFQYKAAGDSSFNDLNTDTSSPYQADWGSTTFVNGTTYDLQIVVRDNSGNEASFGGVSFTYDDIVPLFLYNFPTAGSTHWYNSDPGNIFDIDFLWGSGSPLNGAGYQIDINFPTTLLATGQLSDYTTNWGFDWDSLSEGLHSVKLAIRDGAGNTGSDKFVSGVSGFAIGKDTVSPATPSATPPGGDYLSDQSVTLTSSDATSGVLGIFYTTDGTTPSNLSNLYSGPVNIGPDTILKALAYDLAGNQSPVMTEFYQIAPQIFDETSITGSTSTTITWTTDDPSTSRVVHDTVSHSVLGSAPNYGYADSTLEDSTKVTSHSVPISGLIPSITYYYRTISHGSPETVSPEHSFTTTGESLAPNNPSSSSSTSDGGGGGGGSNSPTVCSDTKPAGAPTLLLATPGVNSVTLKWSEGPNPVSYYLVTYGTSPGVQTFGNPNVGGKGTTAYTVGGLSGGTTYYFKVRAGNGCTPGDFSSELSSTPGGGFISGPAVGFAQGVLGESTSSAQISETDSGKIENTNILNSVLGAKKEPKGGISIPWIPITMAALATLLILLFLKFRWGLAKELD